MLLWERACERGGGLSGGEDGAGGGDKVCNWIDPFDRELFELKLG
jgi:hypothetical protein